MNLDILISAANWLYENSPADDIAKESSAILVYGDGELADALFDLLFTTAFHPDVRIKLIRVAANAEEKRYEFLSRNVDQLEYFEEKSEKENGLGQTIRIRFMSEQENWQSDRYAYAIVPNGIAVDCATDRVHCLEKIPVLHPTGKAWSEADEGFVPVLRTARKVHTAYTIGWNDRYREEEIDQDLYGTLINDAPDDYMLRSSLRFAVSIPWKLAIAGAYNAEELHQKLRNKTPALGGHSIRDYLAWQEHRSWQAFMILDSWSMPSLDTMENYMFRNGHDHREKNKRLHPCLCDLKEDDWFSGKRALKGIMPSEWSKLYQTALDSFSMMDQISLRIHHRCKEIVSQESYRSEMRKRFEALERELIVCHPTRIDIHFENLRLMEKMFERLMNNETNSYHPYALACRRFLLGIEQGNASVSVDTGAIQKAFFAVQKQARVAIERNKYCDYREIDSHIIDWLPWIIADINVDTLWKFNSEVNGFTNLMSSMILRPRHLILVCQDKITAKNLEIYKAILQQRGLTDISVSAVCVSDLKDGVLPIDEKKLDQTVVDVSEAPDDLEYSIVVPQGIKVVYFSRGTLRDRIGAPGCAKFFPQQLELDINEILQIKGKIVLSLAESNDLLGMEEDCFQLWKLCTDIKPGGAWHQIITKLAEAESAMRIPIYRNKGRDEREKTYALPEEAYERLIKNGGLRLLYDLQKRGAISALLIDAQNNELSLKMFPHEVQRQMDYSDSEATLDRIILTSNDQSQFAMDIGYAGINTAIGVYDLHSPIILDQLNSSESQALGKLIEQGFLVKQAEANAYTYKSLAIRHSLAEEGFALEAYVYYTLFLSGCFDDVRGNVRIAIKKMAYNTLETELDVLVIKNGVIGLISCKDTHAVKREHIKELAEQAKKYGIKAKPILVCANYRIENRKKKNRQDGIPPVKELSSAIIEQCELRNVTLIGYDDALDPNNEDNSRKCLVDSVIKAIQ